MNACVLCGSTKNVERHHIGGRNHIAWATMPLCREHHVRLTAMIHHAGVDMCYTPDPVLRIASALKALSVVQWMLSEMLMNLKHQ